MKAWIKRHPIWASVIGVFALLTVIGAVAGDPGKQPQSHGAAAKAGNDTTAVNVAATPTPSATVARLAIPQVTLHVSEPRDGSTVYATTVRLSGKATRGASVTVGGHKVAVSRGRFARTITLARGRNLITVVARKGTMRTAKVFMSVTRKLSAAERKAIAARRAAARAAAAVRKAAAKAAAVTDFKASATTIPYNQLNKNADRYHGKRVRYTGQILQIQEKTGQGGFMLLSVTDLGYGVYDDNIWVDYDHSIRSAQGDVVTVYGTVIGSKSYETQIGGETYVPQVHARYIDE
jgi:hypothetical protein